MKKFYFMIFITMLLVLTMSIPSFAQRPDSPNNDVGTYGLSILKIVPHARSAGMGQAYTAMSDDTGALFYNIAGIGHLKYMELQASHHEWLADTRQSALGFAWPMGKGTIGLGVQYFDEGSIDETILNEGIPEPTGETLTSSDFSFQLGYGVELSRILPGLAFGLGGKFIQTDLAGNTASAIAGDIGLSFKTESGFMVGLSASQFGSKIKFDDEEEKLPFTLRAGLAKRIGDAKTSDSEFNLVADAIKQIDNDVKFNLGGEALFLKRMIVGRVGYRLGEDIQGLTVGAGFRVKDYFFDYAYAPISDLEDKAAHRFSLIWKKGYDLGEFGYDMPRTMVKPIEIKKPVIIEEPPPKDIEIRELPGGEILVTLRINFDFDKYNIRQDMEPILQQLAEVLRRFENSKVKIEGHTDSIGSLEYNIGLSQRRAESVKNWLTANEDLNGATILPPVGYGKVRPIVPNTSAENRFINRRTDLIVYKEKWLRDHGNVIPPTTPTAILDYGHAVTGKAVDVRIKLNGNETIPYSVKLLSPAKDRHTLVVDMPEIYLLDIETMKVVGIGYVKQARMAYHPANAKGGEEKIGYTRVAVDLSAKPWKYNVFQDGNELIIRFE